MENTTWAVVERLNLVTSDIAGKILIYGSADPTPNPGELLLTQITASIYKIGWRFFVYRHGKNLPLEIPDDYINPPGVFYLENVIPQDLNLRDMAENIYWLRQEPVIVAHLPSQKVRATTKVGEVPNLTVGDLHTAGGWLGGASIHYVLRLYAKERPDIYYLCPFQSKGLVYQIYKDIGRRLFILAPFVRVAPKNSKSGWEPITWDEWLSLPAAARRIACLRIRRAIKEFFRRGEPRRIELKWRWW